VRFGTREHGVRLAISLSREFTGGDLVRFTDDATIAVEGADELSSSYQQSNWLSGVASGALYAFRTLRIPRQCLVLTEFSGRLRASDMDVIANGSAIAIAALADQVLPDVPTDGWTIETQIVERESRISSGTAPMATNSVRDVGMPL
jgi:uncharacterized membrane protein YebE (DUF533 family)